VRKNLTLKSDTPSWLVAVYLTALPLAIAFVLQSINEGNWVVPLVAVAFCTINYVAVKFFGYNNTKEEK
jgi:hypothetical protein